MLLEAEEGGLCRPMYVLALRTHHCCKSLSKPSPGRSIEAKRRQNKEGERAEVSLDSLVQLRSTASRCPDGCRRADAGQRLTRYAAGGMRVWPADVRIKQAIVGLVGNGDVGGRDSKSELSVSSRT